MTVESATFLGSLNPALPDGNDGKSEGDDHFRLLKTVLQATFPNFAGRFGRLQSKSGNYTLVPNDNGSIIAFTGGATLSGDAGSAAATLGNGWHAIIFANGVDITFDPNGAETVNGTTTIFIPNGTGGLLRCDGAQFWFFALSKTAASRRISDSFLPHQTAVPDLHVAVDAGAILSGTLLTEIGAQSSALFVAPVTFDRIDRIVIDAATGVISVVTGTENAFPVAPTIPSGKLPNARVLLHVGTTTITNPLITDERAPVVSPAWSTGDVKFTLKNAADVGWVLCADGTIGDVTSGGTARANADTVDLFTLLWNNVIDTWAAVSTGRGANAAADFAAHKTIALTKMLGRALAVAGAGSGLTSRALGEKLGEEAHALSIAELAAHTHAERLGANLAAEISGGANAPQTIVGDGGGFSTGTRINTDSIGSDTAHNTMQPTSFLTAMIKL